VDLFSEKFCLVLKFLHILANQSYNEATCGFKRLYKLKPILVHLNAKFRRVYTPECDVSVDESLMMWKGCLFLKRVWYKIFELREKSDCLHGLVIRVPGYRSRGPGSIPGATRFSEK
jgi:hypothetical protein